MTEFAEIVAGPALAAIIAIIISYQAVEKPADPCRPPVIRMESANIAALPGPNSPACKEALKAREAEKKQASKP